MRVIIEIFTWWNRKTLGTSIWSYFNGLLVGTDKLGNKYYSNKDDTKRWVIYSGSIESTNVSPEWNNWLRYTSINKPTDSKNYKWQKTHKPNLTGTNEAYNPEKNLTNNDTAKTDEYKKWNPRDV